MNKHFRKLLVLSMVIVMMFSMSAVAFADGTTSGLNSTDPVSPVTSINLIKDYKLINAGTTSPAETFTFTIEPYGVWNAGSMYGHDKSTMPALGTPAAGTKTTTVTITAAVGAAKTTNDNPLNVAVSIPTYESIGDFWYKVTETDNKTTGVIYTTNDGKGDTLATENNAHGLTYYIHVQVLNNPDFDPDEEDSAENPKFINSVTLHKEGPTKDDAAPATNAEYNTWVSYVSDTSRGKYAASTKVDNIQNKYNAGSLSIKKEVTGNAGDKDKRFEVTVTFTKPAGSIITSDITYEAAASATANDATEQTIMGQDDASSKWKNGEAEVNKDTTGDAVTAELTNTVKIYIKDGETVTFNNIPYGVSYKVIETEPADDTYTNKIEYTTTADGESKFDGKTCIADTVNKVNDDAAADDFKENATGSITNASDAIKITNNKETAIDVGVILENAPYVALLLIAGAAVVIFARRKSVTEE